MLATIRTNWIKPWLETDLYQQARVELQLSDRRDAVQPRIRRYSHTSTETGHEIARDKPIEEIFDEHGGQLLILGEPGTDKSTKLIELAKALLDGAADDSTKPIPVILNLSSWTEWTKKAKQAPLGEWIQSELVRLYGVSRPRAKQWVEGEEVVPLLDALDEVAAEQQSACVEAINSCRRQRGLQPMAVCCRREEYRKLPAPLDLASGIEVEPLGRADVETYLDKHVSKLQRVREALRDDPQLWDLMNTPLMLTVLFLASSVEADEARSEPDPRRRLYLRFFRKIFSGPRSRRFGEKRSLRWLGWLAAQLLNRDQTLFALENLDFPWLPSQRDERAGSMISGLLGGLGVGLGGGLFFGWYFGLVGGLLFGLGVGLVGGLADRLFLLFELVGGLRVKLVGGLIGGLGGGLIGGLIGGLEGGLDGALGGGLGAGLGIGVGWANSAVDQVDALSINLRRVAQALSRGLIGGLVGGLVFVLFGAQIEGPIDRLFGGFFFGLVGGLYFGLVVGLGVSKKSHDPVDVLSIDLRRLPQTLFFALFLGLVVALVVGLIFGLVFALVGGLTGALVFGLVFGLDEILRERPAAMSKRSAPNEGTARSLRYAAYISSAGVVLAIATAWLSSTLGEGALPEAIRQLGPAMVAVVVIVLAMGKGGSFVAYHWAVRFQLQRLDLAPRNYVNFLDEAAALLFLRKTGGAYQFFHVTFRDFVAETYGAEWLAKDHPLRTRGPTQSPQPPETPENRNSPNSVTDKL